MTQKDDENIDEIRRDIESTRQRISSEIDAIEGKLTPDHAKQAMRDAVAHTVDETKHRVADRIDVAKHRIGDRLDDARSRVGDAAMTVRSNASRIQADFGAAVRSNPIPVALIGIGTGWLAWQTFRPVRRELEAEPLFDLEIEETETELKPDYEIGAMGPVPARYRTEERVQGDGERARTAAKMRVDEARNRVSGAARDARARASGVARDVRGRVSDAATHARDRASQLAHTSRDRASQLAHTSRDRSRELALRSRDRAVHARDAAGEAFDANPIAFGALAVLAGIGLALALPHTRREDELLGPPRRRVLDRARHVAEEARTVAVDSVKEGARVAKEKARQEASDRDLIR